MNKWWKQAVIYQIFPRSYKDSNGDGIGDIKGVISKLDYIKSIGVDAIWLCPIYPSPNNDSGYDVSDYYDIWDELGTIADFEELINEAHKRDLKIIIELVANHTSDEHRWFEESKKSKDNPFSDYYIWRDGKNGKEPNNWLSTKVGGSVWDYSSERDQYYLHLYSNKQPDLNWENQEVRHAVYNIMKFWFDKGVDGFRMDVINKIAKEEGLPDVKGGNGLEMLPAEHFYENLPKVHEYVKEMHQEVMSKYEDRVTIGQTSGVNPEQAYLYTNPLREELDLFLQFDHMDFDRKGFRKLPFDINTFKDLVFKWQEALDNKLWNTVFFGSHDSQRMLSHFGDVEHRKDSAKMLATMQMFLKGTPIIYQGDEIGMSNVTFDDIEDYKDIRSKVTYQERVIEQNEDVESVIKDLQQLARDNARTPMQWNDSVNAGFSSEKSWIKVNDNYQDVNVSNEEENSDSILNYYRKLLSVRKEWIDFIIASKISRINDECDEVMAFRLSNNNEEIIVLANFSKDIVKLNKNYQGKYIIGNKEAKECIDSLSSYEVAVIKL